MQAHLHPLLRELTLDLIPDTGVEAFDADNEGDVDHDDPG
jgi:hypothetical protein